MSRQTLLSTVLLVCGAIPCGAVAEDSPTAAERAAVKALKAKRCSLQINGDFQVISISVTNTAGEAFDDADLERLKQLPHLESVTIRSEVITDEGLQHLAGLKHLQLVSLYSSNVTDAGVGKLRAALPQCTVSVRANAVAGGFGIAANRLAGVPAPFGPRQPAGIPPEMLDRLRQQQAQQGGFGGSSSPRVSPSTLLGLAAQFDIQAELELTREQGTQIATAINEAGDPRERLRDVFDRARQATSPEEREKITAELRTAMVQDQQRDTDRVRELLRSAQLKRLQQVFWQRSGINALRLIDFAAQLQLTEEQRTQIEELLSNRVVLLAQRRRTDSNVSPSTIAEEQDAKILAVLTDEQRARRDEFLGPPLEVTDEQRARQAFVYLDGDENGELSADEFRSSNSGTRRLFQVTEFPLLFPATLDEFTTAYCKARAAARNPSPPLGSQRAAPAPRNSEDSFDELPPAK